MFFNPQIKRKTFRYEPYLKFIRQKPCLVSGKKARACHVRELGDGGVALKPDDTRTVPLADEYHAEQEQLKWRFWEKYNIDIKMVIIRYQTEFIEMLINRKKKKPAARLARVE